MADVTHRKVSTGTVNASVEVDLSDWNDTHVLTGIAETDAANTFTAGPQTINPSAGTLNQGLVVNQTGPASGTTAGPQNYNLISVTETVNGFSGSARDAFDLLTGDASAFRINYTYSGTTGPPRLAGTFAVDYTGTGGTAQPVGLIGSVYSNTAPLSMWGVIGYASLGPLGSTTNLFPLVSEVSAQTGSTVTNRAGLAIFNEGPVQGGTLDAAIMVTGFNIGRGTPGGFKNLISVSAATGGSAPLATTANFFSADTALTIANFANLSNVTVTGNILDFPNLKISGTGGAILGVGNDAAPSTGMLVKSSAATAFVVGSTLSGSSAVNQTFTVDTSNGSGNGVYIFSTAAASGANITTVSTGTNEPLKINAKGSGTIDLGGTSTGGVTVHGSFTATGLVTSADLNADVFSTAHSWGGQQTFTAPILGTPASGNGSNLTNLPTSANFPLGSVSSGGSIAPNTTNYAGVGSGPTSLFEVVAQYPVSAPMTLKNFYATASAAPGAGQTYTLTVRKNAADTAITCTISGTNTTSNDLTHTVAFAAGDLIALKIVSSVTAAAVNSVTGMLTAVTTSP